MHRATHVLALALLGCLLLLAAPRAPLQQAGVEHVAFEVSEGTRLAIDISPDGRTVAFDLLGQIWLLPASGGKAQPVTDAVRDPAEDLDPSFSPDGNWIAFTSRRPGGRGIWLLPANGGPMRRLTTSDNAYEDPEPAWSPDSSRLAFVRGGALAIVHISSGATSQLGIEGLKDGPIRNPVWSPDGRQIAFVHGRPEEWPGVGPDPGGRLYIVPAEGGKASPLLDEATYVSRPAYSPDGKRLAFFVWQTGTGSQLWVADLTQRAKRRIELAGDLGTRRVRWFPDGRALLYSANGRLWRVDPDGGAPRKIRFVARVEFLRDRTPLPPLRVPEPGSERPARGLRGLGLSPDGKSIALIALEKLWVFEPGSQPRAVANIPLDASGLTWSPDGKEVAWCAGPVNSEDLFTTEVASGRSRRLTQLPGREFRPSWSPDGQNIAFIYAETTEPNFAPQRLRMIPARTETVRTAEQAHDLAPVSYTWHMPYMFFGRETPQWSPDSRGLLLFEKPYYGGTNTGRLVDLSGKTHKLDQFPPAATQIQWALNGTLVYVDNDQLWSIAFERDSGTKGEPVLLWDGPAIYPSVSRDGSVLFVADDGLRICRPDGKMQHLGWPLHYRVAGAPPPLLIQDVQVVSESAPPGARSDILIRGGRIRCMAPGGTIAAEPDFQIVPGGGRWVIPGLIDLGAYLWEPAQITGLLYHGVTTLQDMGSQIGVTTDLRDSVEAGLVPGPRIFFVGLQFFPGADPSAVTTGDLWHATAGDSGATRGLALAKGFGASYAYIYQAETLEDALRLIRLAHESGLRVTYARFPLLSFIAAGLDRTEGLPGDESCYDDIVQLLRESEVSVVSSITFYSLFGYVQSNPAVLEEPETAPFLTPFLRGWGATRVPRRRPFYDARAGFARKNVAKAHAAGVVIGAGPGVLALPWAMHGEMEELVRSGLSPLEALQAATSVNARILGVERDIGTVEEGKVADLILLDADPLADIRNTRRIHALMQGGRLIDRKSLMQAAK